MDRVVTVNDSLAQILASRYHIPMPVVLMNCSYTLPEVKSDKIRQRLGLNDDRKIILYQGGYAYTTKALEDLVLSAQFIQDGIIVFMGFGNTQKLESLIEEKGLASKVKILNPVPHWELHEYVSSADVGVIPLINNNLNNYLSSPSKIFEYLMGGVAIAGNDFPEIRKIVGDSAGKFFDSLAPEDIARVINEMIADENKLEMMKQNARQTALTKYNWEMESRKLLDLYKDIFDETREKRRK
ncbi:MAG: glycosyltransferase [bacterium]